MQQMIVDLILVFVVILIASCSSLENQPTLPETSMKERIELPTPILDGDISLEMTLLHRRSVREFTNENLELAEISQLLWAAQGITDPRGYRTAPSAGALYPIELYVVSEEGVAHYDPWEHSLTMIKEGDLRRELCNVALMQESICEAPVTFVLTAVYERIEVKYGSTRSPRYVHLEVGHAAQNLLLQAVSLGLGATPIGAFEDNRVKSVIDLPEDHEPLYLIPVGRLK
jgi:SagB-type dehydrogenase family enzyme